MMYQPYATEEDYTALGLEEIENLQAALRTASRHVDSLTFNRILAAGFDNLTEFQRELIKEVVCRQALFETENAELISSVLSSYSINGVSMQFGGNWNLYTDKGVAMQRDTYSLLQQTGLCCLVLR